MTWLKKAGQVLLQILKYAAGIMPMVTAALPTLGAPAKETDTLTKIGGAVVTAEAMITATSDPNAKTGALKLKAATPLVAQIIQASELLAGKKVKNEALFEQACTGITSNVADLLNSLE